MKVLVTGASGFLGGRLVELLEARGQDVRVLVRSTSRRERLGSPGSEIVEGAIEDAASVARALEGVDRVYHCAGKSADWGAYREFHDANVVGVRNVVEASAAAGVERVVHVSSTDVYGYPTVPCDESVEPRSVGYPYNETKALGDREARAIGVRAGVPVTVVRPATIVGPRSADWVVEMGRLVARGEMVTVGGGRSPAGLVYVDDVAEAMIHLADRADAIGEAYNVCDPSPMTWREYLDRLADALGAPRVSRDLPAWLARGAGALMEASYRAVRARGRPLLTRHAVLLSCRDQAYPVDKLRATGFAFPVGLEEGLRRTFEWLDGDEGRRLVPR